MAMDNDTRGWLLTAISGIACALGAAVIYIDFIIRLIPRMKHFQIQDSNAFLSCSLSLSAGVMLFSALYKMLPSSTQALESGGMSSKAAAWTLIGCFLGGGLGIQVLSRLIHQCMPSHVVDCDHTHEDGEEEEPHDHHNHEVHHEHSRSHSHRHDSHGGEHKPANGNTETSPLLKRSASANFDGAPSVSSTVTTDTREMVDLHKPPFPTLATRPSFKSRTSQTLGNVSKFVTGSKLSCDADGPCLGYSDPCGRECFKNISSRGGTRAPAWGFSRQHPPPLRHTASTNTSVVDAATRVRIADRMGSIDEEAMIDHHNPAPLPPRKHSTSSHNQPPYDGTHTPPHRRPSHESTASHKTTTSSADGAAASDPQHKAHHHHVPQNAFLSLSLQTSIAIALHKLPEGFITYATNHANPELGFTVFLALAIHNVSEGFALALPLYLATQSRIRALLWSFVLGGLSQPLGAGIAAITLKLAERGRGEWSPGERMYGAMFAVTAGIMAGVAFSLLQESLELSHRKGLCMVFAFVGMGVLGVSNALTA